MNAIRAIRYMRLKVFTMWSVEVWKSIFDWSTVVLACLTFVALGGAVLTGNIISERQGEQLRQFNIELETQKGRTVKAQTELLRLQQALAPRSLTVTQGDVLIAVLKKFANQRFIFTTYQDDKEAMHFTSQINAVLQSAGWKIEPMKGFLAFSLETNLAVRIDPEASEGTKKAADAFVLAFNEQGVPTEKQIAPGSMGEPNTIQVRIGKKP